LHIKLAKELTAKQLAVVRAPHVSKEVYTWLQGEALHADFPSRRRGLLQAHGISSHLSYEQQEQQLHACHHSKQVHKGPAKKVAPAEKRAPPTATGMVEPASRSRFQPPQQLRQHGDWAAQSSSEDTTAAAGPFGVYAAVPPAPPAAPYRAEEPGGWRPRLAPYSIAEPGERRPQLRAAASSSEHSAQQRSESHSRGVKRTHDA
jgi:hypothetical protein